MSRMHSAGKSSRGGDVDATGGSLLHSRGTRKNRGENRARPLRGHGILLFHDDDYDSSVITVIIVKMRSLLSVPSFPFSPFFPSFLPSFFRFFPSKSLFKPLFSPSTTTDADVDGGEGARAIILLSWSSTLEGFKPYYTLRIG